MYLLLVSIKLEFQCDVDCIYKIFFFYLAVWNDQSNHFINKMQRCITSTSCHWLMAKFAANKLRSLVRDLTVTFFSEVWLYCKFFSMIYWMIHSLWNLMRLLVTTMQWDAVKASVTVTLLLWVKSMNMQWKMIMVYNIVLIFALWSKQPSKTEQDQSMIPDVITCIKIFKFTEMTS